MFQCTSSHHRKQNLINTDQYLDIKKHSFLLPLFILTSKYISFLWVQVARLTVYLIVWKKTWHVKSLSKLKKKNKWDIQVILWVLNLEILFWLNYNQYKCHDYVKVLLSSSKNKIIVVFKGLHNLTYFFTRSNTRAIRSNLQVTSLKPVGDFTILPFLSGDI